MVRLVHVHPAPACHDLTADFDRTADHDAVAAHAFTIFRAADGAGAGGTYIAALDALAVDRAITLDTHATGANADITPWADAAPALRAVSPATARTPRILRIVASQRVAVRGC
jgi:hypothetical protein